MLILAATPIGNLADASPRLAEVLANADVVYAEDTRQSGKLLQHLGVSRKMSAFHDHSPPAVLAAVESALRTGQTVVYISDAGMPGVSDPGYELVRLAVACDVAVDVIPGPCAAVNALVLSGCPTDAFCFLGFFPVKQSQRQAMAERLGTLAMTAIFFEAPTRIEATLDFLAQALPDTSMALCRELTKLHQETLRGTAAEIRQRLTVVKGEMVLVIAPVHTVMAPKSLSERHQELLAEGLSPSKCVRVLAQEFRLSKRDVAQQLSAKSSN